MTEQTHDIKNQLKELTTSNLELVLLGILGKGTKTTNNVKFICAVPTTNDEVYLLHKEGRDNDLLFSDTLLKCGLLTPDNLIPGVYLCNNLRVVQIYQSFSLDWEVSCDLECDWTKLMDYSGMPDNIIN